MINRLTGHIGTATTSKDNNMSSLDILLRFRLSRSSISLEFVALRNFPKIFFLPKKNHFRNVLNLLKVQKIDLVQLTEIMSIDEVKEKLGEIVDECAKVANELQAKAGFIVLERGFA